ncbi:MAG: hypothetical protein PHS34_08600 [Candidatus Omnitrophica bacterium]|nr:hypothetical protein [Candidatus Omnitrophota bacterium]
MNKRQTIKIIKRKLKHYDWLIHNYQADGDPLDAGMFIAAKYRYVIERYDSAIKKYNILTDDYYQKVKSDKIIMWFRR